MIPSPDVLSRNCDDPTKEEEEEESRVHGEDGS